MRAPVGAAAGPGARQDFCRRAPTSDAMAVQDRGGDEVPGPGERYCTSCRAVVATSAAACPACGAEVGGAGAEGGGLELSFGWMAGTAGALSAATFVALLLVYAAEYGAVVAVLSALVVTAVLSLLWVKLGVVVALLVGSLEE